MDIDEWRSEFPEIRNSDRIHLNNCSVGPLPQRGLAALDRFREIWLEDVDPWDGWLDAMDLALERFAALINADIDEVAMMTSATQSIAGVASAFDFDDRDEVVFSDLDFPSVPAVMDAHRRRGATLRRAESEGAPVVPADAYADQLSERTQLVCTSYAYPFTGGLLEVDSVADAVHDRGGYLFLDAYQAAGVVPIDVDRQDIDMLTAGTGKFMLGGPGLAFLYVDRAVANELEPTNRGWFGVEDRFDFPTRDLTHAAGARRFELGTPPIAACFTAAAGMDVLLEFGIENVYERVQNHTQHLIEGAEARGFEVLTPHDRDRRGGVVNIQVAHPERTVETLEWRDVKATERHGGIRVAPHFYTKTAELDRFLDILEDVASPR